jgi:hypothetical protein
MDAPPQPPHSILSDALSWLAYPVAAAIGGLFAWLGLRTKIPHENEATDAGAAKSRAEARNIEGTTLDRAWDRIDEQQETIDALRAELVPLRAMKEENTIMTEWVRRMRATLVANNLKVPDKWVSGESEK